jgi:L-alanine-DL-glutamate epimerase-like enolase superfamily enzyme
MTVSSPPSAPIESIRATAYRIPTDSPEADGTYSWDSTTLVVVDAAAGGHSGMGYTYADPSTATLVNSMLADVVHGHDAMDVPAAWGAMARAIRNLGRPGIASMAISGVDAALWDLKCKLLGVSLTTLLGRVRERVALYGSGGFTTYSDTQLTDQLGGWAAAGFTAVKMKIGSHPEDDLRRVQVARRAIGDNVELFVDANGAYSRKQALTFAEAFKDEGVTWFEEPVSSDDLEGLHLLRERAPAGMDIAAGEYGYDLWYFRHMLEAEAVDVLQADASRCGGISGFLAVGPLLQSRSMPMSSHCAPALHVAACCALPQLRNMEYFHDHQRIEDMLFDGTPRPGPDGCLAPDPDRPGLGIEFKRADAAQYQL